MSVNQDWICIVRLELPRCPHVFGQAPCTASGNQCYNTWETCQDKCNYECASNYIHFSSCIADIRGFEYCAFPLINAQSIQRSRLTTEPGKSFSSQRYIRLSLSDAPTDGANLDPYWPRGAIPIQTVDSPGSLLGRLQKMYKYFEGYKAEVFTGFCSQHFSEFRREIYMIDEFSISPDRCNGSGQLALIDPLAIAGDATCPSDTRCFAASEAVGNEQEVYPTLGIQLDGPVDNDNEENQPFFWVDSPILSQNFADYIEENQTKFQYLKYIQIGSEIMEVQVCINESVPQGYNVVLVDRGICGTEIAEHKAGSRVYFLMSIEDQHLTEVIERMLCECTDINGLLNLCCDEQQYAVIDRENFDAFQCANPYHRIPFRIFRKNESIRKNINELETLFQFTLYTDPECGAVRIRQCRKPNITGRTISCCEIEKLTYTTGDSYQSIFVQHSPEDCSKAVSDENSLEADLFTTEDALREPCDRRESRKINTFELSTSWVTPANRYLLKANMHRFLKKYRCPMRDLRIRVSNETAQGIQEGDGIHVEHGSIQNVDGTYDTDSVFEVVEIAPGKEYTDICAVENPYNEDTQDCLTDESVVIAAGEPCEDVECDELY